MLLDILNVPAIEVEAKQRREFQLSFQIDPVGNRVESVRSGSNGSRDQRGNSQQRRSAKPRPNLKSEDKPDCGIDCVAIEVAVTCEYMNPA
jgi:hypothetical protein